MLPAAATMIMPVCTALSMATTVGSVGTPNDDPSDRLSTSSRSEKSPSWLGSTAHSIASSTTCEDPLQPNTLSA